MNDNEIFNDLMDLSSLMEIKKKLYTSGGRYFVVAYKSKARGDAILDILHSYMEVNKGCKIKKVKVGDYDGFMLERPLPKE